MYSRIHIRICHPIFAIRIVFVTWCIRSSPSRYLKLIINIMVEVKIIQPITSFFAFFKEIYILLLLFLGKLYYFEESGRGTGANLL